MAKVVKLTQGQLRGLIQEATKKPKPKLKYSAAKRPSEMSDIEFHLARKELSEEDGNDANDASRALESIRGLFYGTPWEKVLSQALEICDTVATHVEATERSEASDDEEHLDAPPRGPGWR
jgi:hypothetical protein